MPGRGLEPLRISPPDPKSGASANFATLAIGFSTVDFGLPIANRVGVANWIQRGYGYGKNASGMAVECHRPAPLWDARSRSSSRDFGSVANNIRFDNTEPINGCN